MFKKGIILGIISFVAAVLLSFTYILTKPIIAQQSLKSEQESISAFLPNVDRIEKIEEEEKICPVRKNHVRKGKDDKGDYKETKRKDEGRKFSNRVYYKCYSQGKLVGYALIASAFGYSSEIKVMIALDKDKVIKGIKVLDEKETPGLGSKISDDYFTGQFKDKKAGELILGESIEAISGATISSRAVIEAVKKEVEEFGE